MAGRSWFTPDRLQLPIKAAIAHAAERLPDCHRKCTADVASLRPWLGDGWRPTRAVLHCITSSDKSRAMPAELKDSQLSLRLPNDLKDRMEAYAQLTGRTKSYVATEALGSYLEWRIPQIEDLKAAVLAADEGDFASDDEVAKVLAAPAARRAPRVAAKPPARRRTA